MPLLNFDASAVAPSKGFDPIPGGWYDAKITASEVKPTKDGSGQRLNLTFEVIGGEFNGRKVFEGLNIKNKSEKAQQISLENLSAICHAVGILSLQQSEQLHGHPMKIKVKVKPANDGYEARNEISGWENINHKTNGGTNNGAAPVAGAQRPAGFGGAPRPAPAGAPAARPAGPTGPAAGRPAPTAGARPPQPAAAQPRPAAPAARPAAPAPIQTTEVDQPWEQQNSDEGAHYSEADAGAGGQYAEGGETEDAPWANE